MYNTSFFKKILLIATVVLLYSCDKDFNAIGDNLIGDDHFGLEPEKYDVVAYDQEISPIQSNGLINNALGIYDDKVFGARTASFATQVSLESYAPSIGSDPQVVSVQLTIPYFSHAVSTDATTGDTTYKLDSIYGKPEDKFIKLSVFESGVQMRSSYFDNGSQFPQLYYTNQNADFDKFKIETAGDKRLNNNNNVKAENDEFYFNPTELKDETTDAKTGVKTTTRVAPQMRLNLDKTFFQTKILNASASVLSASDVFQQYFKGLYFKVEKSGSSAGNMALMDFSKGKITIKYTAKTDITTDAETVREDRTVVINLTGATASLLDDVKNPIYQNALTDQNKTDGDESLYLKGGQGSLAVIELNAFGSKLAEIRNNKWLVNEANLVFHIDTDKMAGVYESKRVYLYDLTNNTPILDYLTDGTGSGAALGKVVYSGIINIDATSKRGTTYKIRLTDHIRNIIKSTTAVNVKLGLVVSGDINTVATNKLKLKNTVITDAPRASVLSPLGTILFGGKSTVPDNKRLKLEVYYTKPN
ncbi:DUF4270 family protein [Flavobacterium sp. LC2016-23]|uniref:DUF4270 domain-containing protein n=1 Tax=Flavobacterium sp. LC2016-23 TaxID=2666330 RepID=UPI0012B05E95|nr:DUF4270 domain-containing protein [Flavobacterium sp. LC2016-23]MRX40745.1 DUF4270 family protein [Flavobacterium sp. LC2016-23]